MGKVEGGENCLHLGMHCTNVVKLSSTEWNLAKSCIFHGLLPSFVLYHSCTEDQIFVLYKNIQISVNASIPY